LPRVSLRNARFVHIRHIPVRVDRHSVGGPLSRDEVPRDRLRVERRIGNVIRAEGVEDIVVDKLLAPPIPGRTIGVDLGTVPIDGY
jgi:hypothetical protein